MLRAFSILLKAFNFVPLSVVMDFIFPSCSKEHLFSQSPSLLAVLELDEDGILTNTLHKGRIAPLYLLPTTKFILKPPRRSLLLISSGRVVMHFLLSVMQGLLGV